MPIKLTSLFNATQSGRAIGWSENVILNYTDPAVAQQSELNGQGWLWYRCQMLGAGVLNTYNRFSTVPPTGPIIGPQRRNVVQSAGLPATGSLAFGPYYNTALKTNPADFTQTVLLIRFRTPAAGGNPIYIRNLWVAGLPDDCDQIVNSFPISGPWTPAIQAWLLYAAFSGNFLGMDIDRGGTNTIKPCSSVGYAPPAQYKVPSHGFVDGQRVVAVGFRAAPGTFCPRGQYRISLIDSNDFTLQGANSPTNLTTLGGFRAVSFVYNALSIPTLRGFTNRKKGRPFGLLAGRRRTPSRPRA